MICKSFDQYPRNELVIARDNLAEAAAWSLELPEQQTSGNLVHILGNLVLATAATADEAVLGVTKIEVDLSHMLTTAGISQMRAEKLAWHLTDRSWQRLIFPLLHIPDNAPELILRPRSRELDVARFVAEARRLKPDRQTDPTITGFGNQMFIGMYVRSLG